MKALRIEKTLKNDGELALSGLPFKRGEKVDVIIRAKSCEKPELRGVTAADLLNSGLVGLWADRDDIGDSSEFARKLREKAQRRRTERITEDDVVASRDEQKTRLKQK